MMNTQIFFLVAAIALALGLVGAVAENVIMTSQQAFADNEHKGGPGAQPNYGQCKEIFNENVCKKKHTGSG
jgi:hypothetical protein